MQIQRNVNLQYLRSFTFAAAKQRSGKYNVAGELSATLDF